MENKKFIDPLEMIKKSKGPYVDLGGDALLLDRIRKAVYPRTIILEGEKYLGAFQAHGAGSLEDEETMKRLIFTLGERAMQFVNQGYQAVFGFEEASERLPESLRKQFVNNFAKGQKSTSISPEFVLNRLDTLAQQGDMSALFSLGIYGIFFELRELQGKDKIWGIVERVAPDVSVPVPRYSAAMKSPTATFDEKFKLTCQMVAYIVTRDLRFAGQILDTISAHPSAAVLTVRGTSHVGLVPAMQILSEDTFPTVDLNQPYNVEIMIANSVYLPVLWNKAFWEEVIQENKVNQIMTRVDGSLKTVAARVGKRLPTTLWGEFLKSRIPPVPIPSGSKTQLTLTQQLQ